MLPDLSMSQIRSLIIVYLHFYVLFKFECKFCFYMPRPRLAQWQSLRFSIERFWVQLPVNRSPTQPSIPSGQVNEQQLACSWVTTAEYCEGNRVSSNTLAACSGQSEIHPHVIRQDKTRLPGQPLGLPIVTPPFRDCSHDATYRQEPSRFRSDFPLDSCKKVKIPVSKQPITKLNSRWAMWIGRGKI